MKNPQGTVAALCAFLLLMLAAAVIVRFTHFGNDTHKTTRETPNVVLLLADDTGYADFQSYGHPTQEWTGVDRMAEEGVRFTQWNSGAVVCSPSRASLLTGRYPVRSGIFGSKLVFSAFSTGGLPKSEVTIAEALKDVGYSTGMVGKWHLGINEAYAGDGAHLPSRHGFDYVGTNLPLSVSWRCDPTKNTLEEMQRSCFLYRNETIVEQPINLESLTSKLLDDTKDFLTKNRENPFFFILSFPQTHASLFCDPRFCGKSKRGLYGDNVNEMGWAVNEVLDHLIDLGIEKDTLVMFLSDHGPIKDGCGEGGSAGILRGGKGTTWEGGIRVPAVAWWPGTIESGRVSHAVTSSLDLFPTIMDIAGQTKYAEQNGVEIDGKVITDVLKGTSEQSPHDEGLFQYCGDRLMAVRYQQYKVHFYTKKSLDVSDVVLTKSEDCSYRDLSRIYESFGCKEENLQKWDPPLVFDVEADPAEQYRLNPDTDEQRLLLNQISKLVQRHKSTVTPGPSQVDRPFNFALVPCCDPPRCTCNYTGGALEEVPKPTHRHSGRCLKGRRRHSRKKESRDRV